MRDWLRSWRAFCGCCGRAYLWRPRQPDPFWCSACRGHVLQLGIGYISPSARTFAAQFGRDCPRHV